MPHKKGLTLVEILVVIVIFSIISSVLFMVFKAGLDSWRRTESHLEIYQNARMALDMITRDLRAAMLDPSYLNSSGNPYITFRGFDSTSASGWRTNSIGDEMYFVAALNPTDLTAVFDLCKVGYWLDGKGTADTRDNELQRFYGFQASPTPNYDFTSGNSDKVALYTTQLNFRYWDDNASPVPAFVDTWDSGAGGAQNGRLPTMVEVTITVREPNPIDPANPKTETFVTNVYIPRSQQ